MENLEIQNPANPAPAPAVEQPKIVFEDEKVDQPVVDPAPAPHQQNPQPTTPPVENPQTPPTENPPVANPKSEFLNWAKAEGFEIDPSSINDALTTEGAKELVAKNYALKFAREVDPFVEFLLEKRMSLSDFQNEVQPIQELVEASPEDLYAYARYEAELKDRSILGTIDPNNEDQIASLWQEMAEFAQSKMQGLDDEKKEALVSQIRNGHKAKYDELINGWTDIQKSRFAAQQAQFESKNKSLVEGLIGNTLDEFLKESKNAALGNPDKTAFSDFIKKEMTVSDIVKKDENGKDVQERGIPFWHKLTSDENFLLKVLKIAHAIESGSITDAAEAAKQRVVEKLNLMPTFNGGSPSNVTQSNTVKFEN